MANVTNVNNFLNFIRVNFYIPWTARRSNQSILKEISLEYTLEGLMPLMRTDLFEKTLMLGKIKGRRRRGQQRLGWLDGITNLKFGFE